MRRDDQKARLILTAAASTIAEKGFAKTTVSEVAARAGVSRGLLHYYFENKDALLAAVVRLHVEQAMAMLATMFSQARSREELSRELTQGLRRMIRRKPEFFAVFFEVWAIGRQAEVVQAELEILYRRFRMAIQDGLEDAARRGILEPLERGTLEGMAVAITALIDGLALQMLTDPKLADRKKIWEVCQQTVLRTLEG